MSTNGSLPDIPPAVATAGPAVPSSSTAGLAPIFNLKRTRVDSAGQGSLEINSTQIAVISTAESATNPANQEASSSKKIRVEDTIVATNTAGLPIASTSTAMAAVPRVRMSFEWLRTNPSTLLHGFYGPPQFSAKLACFDIDGTIITTKSGASEFMSKSLVRRLRYRKRLRTAHVSPDDVPEFPKDADDWKIWCGAGTVQRRLLEYHERGYCIVFISNQNYPPHVPKHKNFKLKMPNVCKTLNVPLRLLAATAKDVNRKPSTGMWQVLATTFQKQGVTLDKTASFYVGDAAGRRSRSVLAPAGPNSKQHKVAFAADHSDSDLIWAKNVGIPFYTPEEFFWDRKDLPVAPAGVTPSSAPAGQQA